MRTDSPNTINRINTTRSKPAFAAFALVWTVGLAGFFLAGSGCTVKPEPVQPNNNVGDFFSPQGIVATDDWIIVANSGYHFEGSKQVFSPGSIVFVDRKTREMLGEIKTSQLNTQFLTVHQETLYVVNGGSTTFDSEGLATVTSDGGIDIVDLSQGLPTKITHNIRLPQSGTDARIGAYKSMVINGDGSLAYLGSGTRGDVFKVDLLQRKVLRGADNPIALFKTSAGENGLAGVRPWKGGVAVISYNSDELCLSDDWQGDLKERNCSTVGVNDELVEGPIDIIPGEGAEALVLMTIANGLYSVNTSQAPFEIDYQYAKTGLANNQLLKHGAYLYIINSMDNNLQRIEWSSRASNKPFAVLPVKSNPFEMVIVEEGGRLQAWITLFSAHQLAVVDLATGAILELLGKPAGAIDSGLEAGPSVDAGATDLAPLSCDDAVAEIVTVEEIVQVNYGEGAGHGQKEMPTTIKGGPGSASGTLSLGVAGELTVSFGAYDIVDGPGPDFIVFENPFSLAGEYQSYAEPAFVALSDKGTETTDFLEFPCDLSQTQGDPTTMKWAYPGCAGVKPVVANASENCIAPTDHQTAGGDAFDLADVGLSRARYLRLRDAGVSKMGSDTKGFDLDAIVLINFEKTR